MLMQGQLAAYLAFQRQLTLIWPDIFEVVHVLRPISNSMIIYDCAYSLQIREAKRPLLSSGQRDILPRFSLR